MQTFHLDREDVRTDLHPRMWEDICDALGVDTYDDGEYPSQIEVRAVKRAFVETY